MRKLFLYNTLTRKKELFEPLAPPHVGMYVCGPTVYGDAHLGHAKSYVSFDLIYRYLLHLGYKVRYVQNITDVGHLTDDADAGEDKILKQSRLEKVEPMEVVEHYMGTYYRDMDKLNVKRPSIAPRPSGHIPEQIEAISMLISKGYAYEAAGSVYFDVAAYSKNHQYGKLSGRTLDELVSGSAARELEGQKEKRSPYDFALWKKAPSEHLMKWKSPWGEGFPGWHIECTVMSQKYLGETFDIHGGGLENAFPHHECEIAQAEAGCGKPFARYWLHNNMVTINGQKMSKSLGNGVFCHELFSGKNKLLAQAFSPMSVRFFILQSHYRSTLDFSNDALLAAEKAFRKLISSFVLLDRIDPSGQSSFPDIKDLPEKCHEAMSDDFNSAVLIAHLFEAAKIINSAYAGQGTLSREDIAVLRKMGTDFITDILGLSEEERGVSASADGLVKLLIEIRMQVKAKKDYLLSDQIRDNLLQLGIKIKDEKDGTTWTYEA